MVSYSLITSLTVNSYDSNIVLTVKTWVGRLGSSSFDVYQEIWQEGEHCATGTTTMVHFNYNTQKAEPVPDAVREKMQNWLKD